MQVVLVIFTYFHETPFSKLSSVVCDYVLGNPELSDHIMLYKLGSGFL